jgi:site-specific recombinase XerD
VPLNSKAQAAVARLVELSDYVAPRGVRRDNLVGVGQNQLRAWISRAGRDAGIPQHCHPHLLRHSALTHMSEAGIDVRTMMEFANHQDPQTTMRYVKVNNKLLREAAEAL